MKNNKLVNIRALAIFLVVFGHSIILYSSIWNYYISVNKVPILDRIKDLINIIQMPLFFSLSGYLFYKTIEKNISFKDFVKKKTKRLLIPFFMVAFFWMIPIKCLVNYPAYQNNNFLFIIKSLLTGADAGHLWYLVTLFILFILMYVLLKQAHLNKSPYDKLVLVFFTVSLIASKKINVGIPYIQNVLFYSFYFYLGFLLYKYDKLLLKIKYKKVFFFLSILLLVSNLFIKNILFEMISATSFIIALYRNMPEKSTQLIEKVDRNSFGIYLFHSPLIYITYTYLTNANPIVVTINFVIFGATSFYMTEVIRKTKLKFIIGEK